MKFTLTFQCGLVETCPHCSQDMEETACHGAARVVVEAPHTAPTNGWLIAAAGGAPECPFCQNLMVLTDRHVTS